MARVSFGWIILAVRFAAGMSILPDFSVGLAQVIAAAKAPIEQLAPDRVSLAGSVVDRRGALVVNARVSLRRRAHEEIIGQVWTNTKGEFSFENLGLHRIELTIEADGFRRKKVHFDPKSPRPVLLPPVKLENLGIVFDNPPG
jgi:hypothetical protein